MQPEQAPASGSVASLAELAIATGLPVFPCDESKRPFRKGGFKLATREVATIRRSFADRRTRMIGVPTGAVSGLVVVDVDVSDGKAGQDWFDNFEMEASTRQHRTRSGGHHLVYQAPEEVSIRNSASRIAASIDVRGDGGYVIWPGSPGYSVAHALPIAPIPAWLYPLMLPPPAPARPARRMPSTDNPDAARRALMRAVGKVATARDGFRNDTLNAQAFVLGMYVGGRLLDLSEVSDELFYAARSAGLTDREIKATLASALSAGMQAPRQPAHG